MSDDEFIAWAKAFDVSEEEFLRRLIWIVKLKTRAQVFEELANQCRMEHDIAELTSYPGKFALTFDRV